MAVHCGHLATLVVARISYRGTCDAGTQVSPNSIHHMRVHFDGWIVTSADRFAWKQPNLDTIGRDTVRAGLGLRRSCDRLYETGTSRWRKLRIYCTSTHDTLRHVPAAASGVRRP